MSSTHASDGRDRSHLQLVTATSRTHTLPPRLEALRNSSRQSRRQVGKRIGISRRTLTAYEAGTQPIPAEHVQVLCDLYGGVSREHLLGLDR